MVEDDSALRSLGGYLVVGQQNCGSLQDFGLVLYLLSPELPPATGKSGYAFYVVALRRRAFLSRRADSPALLS